VRVIAQGGDGGTTDIGFGCLSGMFERNDDVLYICYDNEAYMNTGVQRSSGHAAGRAHRDHHAVGDEPGAPFGQGKNVPLIAMAHEIPYVATATVADLRDLEAKVERPCRSAARATCTCWCPARWVGARRVRHDQAGAAGARDRAVPGVRGRARRGHRRHARSAAACRWTTT
jgi:pyruvate ferredoxin oxidoreductase beta subunit